MPKSARVVPGRRCHRLRRGVAEAKKAVGSPTARRNHQTALGTFLTFGKDRTLHLVEDVEVDGALVAYSNDCFVQGVQHHHGSQLRAAVMDR